MKHFRCCTILACKRKLICTKNEYVKADWVTLPIFLWVTTCLSLSDYLSFSEWLPVYEWRYLSLSEWLPFSLCESTSLSLCDPTCLLWVTTCLLWVTTCLLWMTLLAFLTCFGTIVACEAYQKKYSSVIILNFITWHTLFSM